MNNLSNPCEYPTKDTENSRYLLSADCMLIIGDTERPFLLAGGRGETTDCRLGSHRTLRPGPCKRQRTTWVRKLTTNCLKTKLVF